MKSASHLRSTAMLARLEISQMSNSRKDRAASDEVTSRKGAATGAARVNKSLFPDNALLKDIASVANEARTLMRKRTLPWSEGVGILRSSGYGKLRAEMDAHAQRFDALVMQFERKYDEAIELAKTQLGALFDENDYPADCEVRGLFKFNFVVEPMPSTEDWRLDVDEDVMEDLRAKAAKSISGRVETASKAAFTKVYDTVKALHERLSEPDNIFRDSLIGNVRELAEVLPSLNLMDDPELERLTRQLIDTLGAHEPGELRNNKALRADIATEAGLTLKSLQDIIGEPEED